MGKLELGAKDGRKRRYFQPFFPHEETKKRGGQEPHRALIKFEWKQAYSASFFMVGMRPMCGLPVGP